MPAGLFGITDETVNLVVNLLVFFLVVLWLALIAWTFFDARRRVEDPVLVAFATVAAVLPFVGPLVYTILRPPEFIEERHERELEIRASELRVRQLEEQSCPNCEHPLERTYLRCPNCRARIKNPCPACSEPIDPRWSLCPYCETALRRVPASERRGAAKKRPVERVKEGAPQPTRKPPASSGDGVDSSKSRPSRKDRPDGERKPSPSKSARESARRSPSSKRRGQPTG